MELDCPKDIQFDSLVVDVCCHPHRNVIAAGDIDGDVTVHSYSVTEENHLLLTLPHHKKACRALGFTPSGDRLVTASKDKSIQVVDMESGSVKHKLKKAHECPLYSLLVVDENILASGDDDGHFKVWDLRHNKCVMDVKENDEFLSDMAIDDSKRLLVASSGDGTLSAFDIRKHKLKLQSELFDSELLSIAKVKGGEKIVVGTGEGVLNIFNWGEWGNFSDRMPGHPLSVDCMVPITDSIIITGSMDGIVRAVNILPNRFIGVVGEHSGFPVENMSRSHCGNLLATCSHDQTIKFWNISDVEKEKVSCSKKANKSRKNKPLTKSLKKNDFFSDLAAGEGTSKNEDNESDENESDDNESESDDNENDDNETKTKTNSSSKGATNIETKSKLVKNDDKGSNTISEKDTDVQDDEADSDFVSDDDITDDESEITNDQSSVITDDMMDRSDLLNDSNLTSSSSSSEDSDTDTQQGADT